MPTTAQHHAGTRIDINGWRETISRACDDLANANRSDDPYASIPIINRFVRDSTMNHTPPDTRCDCKTTRGTRCQRRGANYIGTPGGQQLLCTEHFRALTRGIEARYAAPARPGIAA